MDDTDIFGMEDFALDHLTVLEGDLAPLYDPEQDAIAAVYLTGDYGEVHDDSHWAKPGDKIKVRRVDEWKYYTNDTNEEIPRESSTRILTACPRSARSLTGTRTRNTRSARLLPCRTP